MVYRFAAFELDDERRELRLNGQEVLLQPLVFDLLAYLVKHRDRVVGKRELLEQLWPDAIVTDASLQRAISLARSALRDGGLDEAIRTHARHGYRFAFDVEQADPPQPALAPELQRARRAFERGDWEDAAGDFREADRAAGLRGADLERWAYSAQWSGDLAEAIPPLERAVAAHVNEGDQRGAGRAAVLLAQLHLERRETAVGKGWLQRAGSFLQGLAEGREHGLLEWVRARLAAYEGELDECLRRSQNTSAIGRRVGDRELEIIGRLYEGLALLALGDVRRGLDLYDEAATAVLSGEISGWMGGWVFCTVISGYRNRSDWRCAGEWAEHFTRWCETNGLAGFPGLCRLHRAEVLAVVGDLDEAETEARGACDQLSVSAPWAEGDGCRVVGEIRLMRGDVEGAEEAFRRSYELGWEPQPGFALVQVAKGRADAAIRGLERAIDQHDWANQQRRGMLLAHMVVVAAAAGHAERAHAALAELDANPELWSTPSLQADVARARAEVALLEGRRSDAVAGLRQAANFWRDVGSPINVASVRLRLARILAEDGDPDGAELELSGAEAGFRKARVPELLEACRELRRTLGLDAPSASPA